MPKQRQEIAMPKILVEVRSTRVILRRQGGGPIESFSHAEWASVVKDVALKMAKMPAAAHIAINK